MRTPVGWTQISQTSLQVMCVCCALWCAPAAALAAPDQIARMPVASTSAPAAATSATNDSTADIGGMSIDKRVLTLLAMGYLIGMIAGWVGGGPRETRFRLFNKPKKARLSVLVPPGPAPRLIPGDSPHATRAGRNRAPVPRQPPVGTRSRVIDYLAAFADPAKGNEEGGVDYLLPNDSGEESSDRPDDFDGSLHHTG